MLQTDVLIIGAGIGGLSTAIRIAMARPELNITVLTKTDDARIDLMTSNPSRDCRSFTMEEYRAIARWKTTFYTLLLPVHLGIALSRANLNQETMDRIDELLVHLGIYFQVSRVTLS